ncbi:transmembrane protein 119 isoform X1 [Carettochelys insculpta]|uniref:transmembrane protein 119 isoform X1 n=2 Tax=Carettochelys insculpta TaxID=44489 RepID=UPI003EBCABA3
MGKLRHGAMPPLAQIPVWEMAPPAAVCVLLMLMAPLCTTRSTRLQAVLDDNSGSGDSPGASSTPPSVSVNVGVSPTSGTITVNGTVTPFHIFDRIVNFFKEYMLLIIVVGSLVFLLLFIVCAAVIFSQKHKASAYYPSSFPKKKYVDQNDRSGGSKAFNEIPEKAPETHPEESVDSSKQLQADILAAAQNLKSPAKVLMANGDGTKIVEKSPKEQQEGAKREEGKPTAECAPQEQAAPQEKAEPANEMPAPNCTAEMEAKGEEPPTTEEAPHAQQDNESSLEEPKECPAPADPAAEATEGEKKEVSVPAGPDTCTAGPDTCAAGPDTCAAGV